MMKHFVKVNGFLVQIEQLETEGKMTIGQLSALVCAAIGAYILISMIFCF